MRGIESTSLHHISYYYLTGRNEICREWERGRSLGDNHQKRLAKEDNITLLLSPDQREGGAVVLTFLIYALAGEK